MWKLFSSVRKWIGNYIYFSKATSCIRGLVLSHSYVKQVIISVLIMYITNELWKKPSDDEDNFQDAAVAINVLNGISGILVCVLAFISNTVGPFKVIASTNAAYLLGLVLLWRLSIHVHIPDEVKKKGGTHPGHASDNYVFYGAGLLLALGEAGRSAGMSKFLDDQYLSEAGYKIKLPETSSVEEDDDTKKRVESRQTAMWNQPWFIGAAAAAPLALVFESWPERLQLSVIAVGVSYLLFWYGVFAYSRNIRNESKDPAVEDSPRRPGLSQAFKILTPSKETAPSWKFWLKPVSRKRYYKEMLVMCLAFMVYSLVEATGSTFFFKQVSRLYKINKDLKIPPFYFSILKSLSSFLISYLWKLLVPKQSKRATLVKIGCGLICSVLCMVAAWQVEIHQRTKIDPKISTSILWLIPQFSLLGFTKGLAADGLVDFFADRVDADGKRKAMYYGSCAGKLVLGIGTLLTAASIVGFRQTLLVNDLQKNRLDKYYRGVVFIGVANLCYYFCVAVYFYRKQDDNAQVCCEPDGNEQSETSFKNNKYRDQDVSLISVRETPTKSSSNCCAIFF